MIPSFPAKGITMQKKQKNEYLEKVKNNSYIKIPTDIQEAIYKSNLSKNEHKTLDFIIRKTWGWNKDREVIRVKTFSQEIGLDKGNISRALTGLQEKKIVVKLTTNLWQIQLDIAKWKTLKKKKIKKVDHKRHRDQFVVKTTTPVVKTTTPVVKTTTKKSEEYSKNVSFKTPKETLLKETIKQQQEEQKSKPDVVVSSLSEEVKPKNQNLPPGLIEFILPKFNDRGWHTLTRATIIELTLITIEKGKKDIPNYFRYWKTEIDKKKSIHNKPGYLVKMVKYGNNPPLYEEEQTV